MYSFKEVHQAYRTRLQRFVQNQAYPFYLQLDIKSFFLSIHKNILFEQIRGVVSARKKEKIQRILYLSNKIIFDDPTLNYVFKGNTKQLQNLPQHKTLFSAPKERGLAIGNLTSQFFANVYMNGFDNFVKRTLKVKYYMRYVDDMVLLGRSKEELQRWKNKIEIYLKSVLNLELRELFFLKPTHTGIDFLGYVVKPSHTLVRQRVVNNFKHKKAQFLDTCFKNGTCSLEDALKFKELNASFYGHVKHADSFALLQKYHVKNWIRNENE